MPTGLLPVTENTAAVLKWRWLIWWVAVTIWTVALLTPQPVVFAKKILPHAAQFPVPKLLHIAVYAFLTILSAWLRVRGAKRWLLVAFLSLHGGLTEYFQTFIPPRTGSWRDVGLDHLGILLGLWWSWKGWRGTVGDDAAVTPPGG